MVSRGHAIHFVCPRYLFLGDSPVIKKSFFLHKTATAATLPDNQHVRRDSLVTVVAVWTMFCFPTMRKVSFP